MAAASRCISWQLRFAPARRKRTIDKSPGQRQLAQACGIARSSAEAAVAPQGAPFPQAETNFGQYCTPARVRFSILETSGQVHAKCTTRRQELASESGGPRVRKRASEFQKQPPLSLEWEITARPGACLGRRYQTGNSI